MCGVAACRLQRTAVGPVGLDCLKAADTLLVLDVASRVPCVVFGAAALEAHEVLHLALGVLSVVDDFLDGKGIGLVDDDLLVYVSKELLLCVCFVCFPCCILLLTHLQEVGAKSSNQRVGQVGHSNGLLTLEAEVLGKHAFGGTGARAATFPNGVEHRVPARPLCRLGVTRGVGHGAQYDALCCVQGCAHKYWVVMDRTQ